MPIGGQCHTEREEFRHLSEQWWAIPKNRTSYFEEFPEESECCAAKKKKTMSPPHQTLAEKQFSRFSNQYWAIKCFLHLHKLQLKIKTCKSLSQLKFISEILPYLGIFGILPGNVWSVKSISWVRLNMHGN